jgi:hypothetical protein
MDSTHRQAFLELEKMIITSKIECFSAIPKERIYDDSEIKKKIQSLESKNNKLDNLITNYVDYLKIEISNLKNAHSNVLSETRMVDDYITLFDTLTSFFAKTMDKFGYSDPETIKTFIEVKKTIKNIIKQRDLQNKTYNIYLESGGEPQEEYMKKRN